jgi:hypothetical protein
MSETSNYTWKCTTGFEFRVSLSTHLRNPMVLPPPKATRKPRVVGEGEVGIRREVRVLQGLERRRKGAHGLLLSIRRRRKPDCCEWSVAGRVELRETRLLPPGSPTRSVCSWGCIAVEALSSKRLIITTLLVFYSRVLVMYSFVSRSF